MSRCRLYELFSRQKPLCNIINTIIIIFIHLKSRCNHLTFQDEIRAINDQFLREVDLPDIAAKMNCGIFWNDDVQLNTGAPTSIWLLAFPPTTTGLSKNTYNNRTVQEMIKGGLNKTQIIIVELAPLYGLTNCGDFDVATFEKLPEYSLFVQRQLAVYRVWKKYAHPSSITIVAGDMVNKSTWVELQRELELNHVPVIQSYRQSSANMINSVVLNTEDRNVVSDDSVNCT